MSLNARGVKTPDLVASLESYNSCRSHFPNLTRWESEKSLRKADFLDFWNLGAQFLPPKWRSRTISSSKTQKYWQTIFIRLCGVYKQATNPVYLSFRPHMAARVIHIDNEEKKKIRRLREEQARASQRRDNDSDDGFLISNDNII